MENLANKVADLWTTKRWLFILLLPVGLIALGIKVYMNYLSYKSDADIKETKKEDKRLKRAKEILEEKAEVLEQKADKIEEKIEERKIEDVDLNWHLKDKKKRK